MAFSAEELEKRKEVLFKKPEDYKTICDFFEYLASRNEINYVSFEESRSGVFKKAGVEERVEGLRGIISEGICNSVSFYTIKNKKSNNSHFDGIGFVLHHNPEMIAQSTIDLIDHVSKCIDLYFNLFKRPVL